jgi:hypothetical protein
MKLRFVFSVHQSVECRADMPLFAGNLPLLGLVLPFGSITPG